jgi:helix-turn-helix protein
MSPTDLLTVAQVADYLSFAGRAGALRWLRRNDVRMSWRGRRLLVRKADIDRALDLHTTGDTVARARSFRKAS